MGLMVSHLELHDSDPSPVILFLPLSDTSQHGCSVRPFVKPSIVARQSLHYFHAVLHVACLVLLEILN